MELSIKDKMKENDIHFVVCRHERTLKCWDAQGKLRWAIPALAFGQHENWREPNGDTPPGLYRCGTIYDTPGEVPYGPFCVDLEDLENQETGNGRAGISLHGGGSGCPDPFADYQPLLPTHGCVRVHNAHLVHRVVPAIRWVQGKGGTAFLSVVE